jgi:two-component system sensor histidine kinase PilS (NtrC family)
VDTAGIADSDRRASRAPGRRADATPAELAAASLTALPRTAATGRDLARRMVWLMLLRTVVVSLMLGLSYWLAWAGGSPWSSDAVIALSLIVGATYASTLVYALLVRAGVNPERLVWPQLAGDLLLTAGLVWITGGAQSAYGVFFALSIVGASTVHFRRGAVIVTAASLALMTAVCLLAWAGGLPVPVVPQVVPSDQTPAELGRSLGLNLAATAGVGVLSFILGDQLQRAAQSLATERRAVADLVTLHQDIVRSLSSGLVTVDPQWRVLTINQAATDILGIEAASAVGSDVERLLPGLRGKVGDRDPRQPLRRADLELARGERTLVVGISVSPLRDVHDAVVGRVINFQDLTDLRRMEHQMRRAERMATLGQLSAGIAHEIRNPLASISGSIELLRQGHVASEDDAALMAIVNREIDRLNGLISDLLDWANPRPPQIVDLDLAVLVDETVRVFRQDKSSGVEVGLTTPRELVMAGDAAKLRQVVWNLLRNAAEAAAAGGGHVEVAVGGSADTAEIVISDDGAGIPREHLSRVFDPFFTTKKRGTGLGLATCHSIVTDHGGSLDVASDAGGGTRVVVRLPRRRGEAGAAS